MVTGATGFIGRQLTQRINFDGKQLLKVTRRGILDDVINIGNITYETNWYSALENVDCVIHLAARVHDTQHKISETLSEYRDINVEGTLNLARQSANAGVRRFIFISTIKVNGDETFPGHPFTENDIPNPTDPYSLSKYEAELGLRKIADNSGMDVVIIRPPLVYGPGVKANFQKMMRSIMMGFPLPFGAIHNKRSMVALDNLVDLIVTCIDHSEATNQTFLVSDDDDLSTTDLLERMSNLLGKPSRLIRVSPYFLKLGAKLIRKEEYTQRLLASLQVDISSTRRKLDWKPVCTVDEELAKTAEYFLSHYAP